MNYEALVDELFTLMIHDRVGEASTLFASVPKELRDTVSDVVSNLVDFWPTTKDSWLRMTDSIIDFEDIMMPDKEISPIELQFELGNIFGQVFSESEIPMSTA